MKKEIRRITKVVLVGSRDNRIFNDVLSTSGFDVACLCETGEYAVNVYSNYEPDVIIIDSILPGMDGLETARWIKEQTNSIKIVMVAQHFNDEFLLACVELNLNGYIMKNSSEQILIELN